MDNSQINYHEDHSTLDERLEQMTRQNKADFNEPMPADNLPDKGDKGAYKATIRNLKAIFSYYGFGCYYNVISKKQLVSINGDSDSHDLKANSDFAILRSVFALNNLPMSTLDLLPRLLLENTINPILKWIESKPYNGGRDYFREVADSLVVDNSDKEYRDLALKTWFLQCVAAADYAKRPKCKGSAKFELVLVLQGLQGLGKTTWIKSLLPKSLSEYVITGAHLDPSDKDSVKTCIESWICELGELDATLRKADSERLKAFLSQGTDTMRLPYERGNSDFARRTSFCGSVNPENFLIDKTGNRRFLPLALKQINRLPEDETFLQQFWAQIWQEYLTNQQAIWWPSAELETMLQTRHQQHAQISPTEDKLMEKFDLTESGKNNLIKQHYTPTKALGFCGIDSPTPKQANEAKIFIEKQGFPYVGKNGVRGFWLALNTDN